jgi:hypothetical protein
VGETLVFLALAALHLGLSAPMRSPMIFGDEAAYLGIARFLAARPPYPLLAPPVMGWTPSYHFGYSLLLAPVARLAEPLSLYHAALALNGIALAALFLLLSFFARRVLGLPRLDAGIAALAASLYPAFLVQANLAWSESLLIAVVAWLPVAFYRLVQRPRTVTACTFCFVAVFAYAVHQRALGLVPLALLAVAGLWRAGRLPGRAALAAALTMGAALASIRAVEGAVLARLWAGSAQRLTAADMAARLADPASLGPALLALAGQLWYLTVASVGLFPLGVWVLVRTARRGEEPEQRLTAALTLAAAAVLLATSALFFGQFLRADTAVYGRYAEAFLAPFLTAGLAGFYGSRHRLAAALTPVLLIAALAAAVLAGQDAAVFQRVYNLMNIAGIAPLVLALGGIRLLPITAAGIAAALAVHGAGWVRPRAAAVLAGALFLAGGLAVQRWMVPTNHTGDAARSIPRAVLALGAPEVAYDLGGFAADEYFAYQFRLGDTHLAVFDSRDARRGPPPQPLVISAKSFGRRHSDARLVFPERFVDQALWVMSGPLQSRLGAAGRLFPADPAAPLPLEACRSRLAWAGGKAPPRMLGSWETRQLQLRVTHRGTGAPWLPADVLPSAGGSVRIAVVWSRAGARVAEPRVELPWALAPGDEAVADLPFAAQGADGKPLPPGRYEVRIGLVQELVQWFTDAGDGELGLAVEVR